MSGRKPETRRRARAGVWLLGGTIALLAALPAAAEAKPPKTFYGVVPQTQLNPDDVQRMGLGRVGTLRVTLAWAALNPTPVPGHYEWDEVDKLVGGAAYHGIEVLPAVYSTPAWVAQVEGCNGDGKEAGYCYKYAPRSEVGLLAWRTFLRAAVARYGSNGTYWAANPQIPKKPIRVWQVWNEQNSPQYFAPRPDADVYAKLVTEASRAIKEEDPGATVILGGMFGTPAKSKEFAAWTYLARLYRKGGFEDRFDGVAVHPYYPGMRGIKYQIDKIRTVMKRAGDGRTGLWITEIGVSSSSSNKEHYLNVGRKRQARLLNKSFRYFTRSRKSLHVKTVNWFAWKDAPPEVANCIWCDTAGLFSATGLQPKRAWNAFVGFTGGR